MGESPEDAWNHTSIELVQAAEAHCRSFLVLRFAEWVKSLTNVSKELHEVLKQLCEMYAVYWVLQRLGDFLRVIIIVNHLGKVKLAVEFFFFKL